MQEYTAKTDEELKKIAKDLWAGQIFCDRQVKNPNDLTLVFMVLALSDAKTIDMLKAHDANFIYEYIDQAGPRAINGMPSFFSFRYLNTEDTKRMFGYYDKVKEFMEKI